MVSVTKLRNLYLVHECQWGIREIRPILKVGTGDWGRVIGDWGRVIGDWGKTVSSFLCVRQFIAALVKIPKIFPYPSIHALLPLVREGIKFFLLPPLPPNPCIKGGG